MADLSVKLERKSRMLEIQEGLESIAKKQARTGWFQSAKYPDGTPVSLVAVANEYGHGSTPPRSFVRPTIEQQRNTWINLLKQGAQAVANGEKTIEQVLELVGLKAAGDIAKTISAIQSPPLKESTIKARERRYAKKGKRGNLDKPLVDSALMINSITAVVEDR